MKRPDTVVILNDFAHERGGADQVAINGAIGLAERGYQVLFFSAVGPVDPRLEGRRGLRCICLGNHDLLGNPNRLHSALEGLWNLRTAAALGHELSRLDPERCIVHVHCYSKALTASAPNRALNMGFRTVLTLHDYFLGCPNGALFRYPSGQHCDKIPMGMGCLSCRCDARNHAHKLWRYVRGAIQNRFTRLPQRLSCVIVLGETCRKEAARFLPPDTPVELVRNPVDIQRLEPLSPCHDMPLLYIGRIETYKGVFRLAEAARKVGDRVVFCGDGSALGRLQSEYPEFEYTGRLDRLGLRSAMARTRALVFPSLWRETFGLTVLEAMAAGLPPIVAENTAPAEFIRHGEDGLLFSPAHAEALHKAFREIRNPGLVSKLGMAAYKKYWSAPLSTEAHCRTLGLLYDRL